MEIRKLRHAVTLARVLNFTRAAQELHLTQSALSRSIQALETECRIRIFDRNRGTVALTQAGREFIRHAETLVRSEAALLTVARQVAHGEGGSVSLGVTPLAARCLLAPVLARRVGQAHFHADVVVASGKELFRMIAQETIDIGISGFDLSFGNTQLSATGLAELAFAIVVRGDHPLTRVEDFDVHDVEQYPQVRSTSYSSDDALPVAGLVPSLQPAVTVEDFGVIARIVATSDAVWMTCPIAVTEEIRRGELVQLPIPWLPATRIPLVARQLAKRTLSPLAQSMLEHLREVGKDLSAA
jgi:DNA-binding transcriptional LysR family regulator